MAEKKQEANVFAIEGGDTMHAVGNVFDEKIGWLRSIATTWIQAEMCIRDRAVTIGQKAARTRSTCMTSSIKNSAKPFPICLLYTSRTVEETGVDILRS